MITFFKNLQLLFYESFHLLKLTVIKLYAIIPLPHLPCPITSHICWWGSSNSSAWCHCRAGLVEHIVIIHSVICNIPSLRHQGHSLSACNAIPPAIPNHLLNPKWPTGSGKRFNLRLFDPPINFRKISFLIWSFLLWEPQKSKRATRGPKMAGRVWKGVNLRFFSSSVNFC